MSVFSWRTIIPQSIHVIRQWHHQPCLLTLRVGTWPRNSLSKHCWMSQQAWKMHGALSGTAGRWVLFFFGHTACGTLVLRRGIKPQPHSLEVQSLHHWTSMEFSRWVFTYPKITEPVCSGRNKQEWNVWEGESLECQTKAPETIFQQQEARKLVFEKLHVKIGVFRGLVWQLCGG